MLANNITHPAWIEIDLGQYKRNIRAILQTVGQRQLCVAVKANAYGHGLVPMATAAVEAGANYLAVACLQEGVTLRQAGILAPILVLGAFAADQIPDLLAYDLDITISSHDKADLLAQRCMELGKNCNIHLEVDTGMQRTGMRPESAYALFLQLQGKPCFAIVSVYSHLATADKPDDAFALQQIDEFSRLVAQMKQVATQPVLFHLAHSGGICYYPDSYFDMVRPGLLAFGYFPDSEHRVIDGIAPCLALKAKISYFKVVPKDTGVSYGHTYHTPTQTRIITLPIGYGDGYRRALSNRGQILLHGQRFAVSGTICMDQFMVDIGDHTAFVGDEVVLIGQQDGQQLTLEEVASACGTIPYEILCGFNLRLPRYYSGR
jgi:alanine racemase